MQMHATCNNCRVRGMFFSFQSGLQDLCRRFYSNSKSQDNHWISEPPLSPSPQGERETEVVCMLEVFCMLEVLYVRDASHLETLLVGFCTVWLPWDLVNRKMTKSYFFWFLNKYTLFSKIWVVVWRYYKKIMFFICSTFRTLKSYQMVKAKKLKANEWEFHHLPLFSGTPV